MTDADARQAAKIVSIVDEARRIPRRAVIFGSCVRHPSTLPNDVDLFIESFPEEREPETTPGPR